MKTLPPPEALTPEAFAPYGQVLRRDPDGELFQPLFTDSVSAGWRVALLRTPAGPLGRLHRHPDSEECFAPLSGHPCIAVALPESPDDFRLFRLDEPVCVRRLVWHEVVSTDEARVFIAENAEISGEPRPIDPPIPWEDGHVG